LRQLTHGGPNQQPAVTPDGRWVLYESSADGGHAIWKIPIDGGAAVRLTAGAASWPRVSPDGTLFACAYSDNAASRDEQLALLSLDGARVVARFSLPSSATLNNG